MYNISPQLANNYSTNDSLNELLVGIDKKISSISSVEYNNIRLGFDRTVDMEKYHDLCQYKKILLEKLLGCNCLGDEMLIMIVSKIKTLIR